MADSFQQYIIKFNDAVEDVDSFVHEILQAGGIVVYKHLLINAITAKLSPQMVQTLKSGYLSHFISYIEPDSVVSI